MKKRIVTFLLAAVISIGGLVAAPMTALAYTQDEGGNMVNIYIPFLSRATHVNR